MKLRNLTLAVLVASSFGAHAAITYNANVNPGVIFGSGNANGSFTVDSNNGIELGLRGKLRHNPAAGGAPANIFNSNGDGTYSFVAQQAIGASAGTGVWSMEYAINTNTSGTTGLALDDLTYVLGIDTNPTQATSFLTVDVINGVNPGSPGFGTIWWDHAMGTNNTCPSLGVQPPGCTAKQTASSAADYANKINTLNVAQNSQKGVWLIPGYSPTADATYDFYLAAFRNGVQVARTDIEIIQGAGGTPIPEPGSLALAGLALFGLAAARRRR